MVKPRSSGIFLDDKYEGPVGEKDFTEIVEEVFVPRREGVEEKFAG